MGLVINVEKVAQETDLIKPCDMLKRGNENKIFQQYSHGKPQDQYYINCGINEERVIMVWYDDESETFKLSTDNFKGLREFYSHVRVKDVTDQIEIQIQIKK